MRPKDMQNWVVKEFRPCTGQKTLVVSPIRSDVCEFRDGTKLDKCELGSTEMVANGVWPEIAAMNRI